MFIRGEIQTPEQVYISNTTSRYLSVLSFGKLKAYASSTLAHTTKNSIVIIKCGNFNKITPLNSPNAFFFIYSFKAKPSYTNPCQAYFSDKQLYLKLVNEINIYSSIKQKLQSYMTIRITY